RRDRARGDVHAARDLRRAPPGRRVGGSRERARPAPRRARLRGAARALPDRPERVAGTDLPPRGPRRLGRRRHQLHGPRLARDEVIVKPHVDWLALAPSLALLGACGLLLMIAVFVPRGPRRAVAAFTGFAGFVTSLVFAVLLDDKSPNPTLLVHDAMVRDRWG